MAPRVFYSFHYDHDSWRVSQVRNMGVVEGQPILSSNEWEDVKKGGDAAIRAWIDEQMKGKSCVVVLIGRHTAGRKWVSYEIEKGWTAGKGVVGVYIHNLEDQSGKQDSKGENPLASVTVDGTKLSVVAKTYDPPYQISTNVYKHIKENLESWVDEAIAIRKNH